jgi:hypothetical protein
LKQLRKIAHVFGLRTLGDKKDLVNSIVDFIEDPYGEGYGKGEAPASSSESEDEEGDGAASDDDAIQALDTLARGGDAKKEDKKKRKRSDLDDDDAPLTLVAPGPSKRLKKEEDGEERPSILAHSKKKPASTVPDKPPPRKPGRPRKSEQPPIADLPKPKLTPEQRLVRSKLEEFVRAIAGKAGYRLKSDVLVGYVYGTLGMEFARDNMDLIAKTVSEYLGR